MNLQLLARSFFKFYGRRRKLLRGAVLAVGLGVAGMFLYSMSIDASWLAIGGWGALMALLEIVFLLMSPAGLAVAQKVPPQGSVPYWQFCAYGAAFFVLSASTVPVSLWLSDENAPEPRPIPLAGLFPVVLLIAALFFLVHLAAALTCARDGKALQVTYLFRPKSSLLRFESWYVYPASVVYGFATGMVLGGQVDAFYGVLIISGVLIQAFCFVLVRLWTSLGEALRDASKFLLRQSILTVLLCLSIVLPAREVFTNLASAVVTAATLMLLINAAEVAMLWARSVRTKSLRNGCASSSSSLIS
jgi:hypothetical protein